MRAPAAVTALIATLALTACQPGAQPASVQPPGGDGAAPFVIQARQLPPQAGPYSCVRVLVTNRTRETLHINPLFFDLTGSDDVRRKAVIGLRDGDIEMMDLAPGEKTTGLVCADGNFTADVVTFTKNGNGESARAEVVPFTETSPSPPEAPGEGAAGNPSSQPSA
ncbi:hypothetical protein [Actinomadura litoris]|uniref:hypothetical protein n=1 Tax=Actinomadura litoris TaxID=2678616 RepID=UPI001FA7A708|nr:hypothetical protein [Actinomadura litoris]